MPIILKNNPLMVEQPVTQVSTSLDELVAKLKNSTDALVDAVSNSLENKEIALDTEESMEPPTTIEVNKEVSSVTAVRKDGTVINKKRIKFFVNGNEVELTKEMQLLIDKTVPEL